MSLFNPYYEHIAEMTQDVQREYDQPFVISYPRHPNRVAVLALLLRDTQKTVYYYALNQNDTSVAKFLENLVASAQFPQGFGQQILSALQSSSDPEAWAEALAADLANLNRNRYMLVLDDIDRIQGADIYQANDTYNKFFLALADYLPSQAQIVVNGRELFRQPWNEIIHRNKGVAIGDENALGDSMFAAPSDKGVIEFYSLTGDIRVLSDGYQVTSWDGALPRNLCYYFIEKERVTRDQIFNDFWPHLGVKEATNVYHVTKRKISEKLGYDITAYSGGFYVLADNVDILYDAREFERAYDSAMNSADMGSPAKWIRAVYLYRHPYLEGLDLDWVVQKREDLSNKYVQALIELGRFSEMQNDRETALGYYLRAVAENAVREDVHCKIMGIYYNQGRIDDVHRQYKFLERELKRLLNIGPSKNTRSLYEGYISG
jgi:DNA-binding SARP family transcriptional activator